MIFGVALLMALLAMTPAVAKAQVVVGRDLVTTSAAGAPAVTWPGATFTITDTARNVGTLDAAASTTRYYLSLDAVKSSSDVRLTGSRPVPVLTSLSTSTGTATVTVPASVGAATYLVLACADDTGAVAETSNANNCVAAPQATRVALPDLVVNSSSQPPAYAGPGSSFGVSDTTHNIAADAPAPATSTRHYLSADAVKNAGDILLSGTRSVPALAAGASSSGTQTVKVPTTATLGSYHVLTCADDTVVTKDADRANNCMASGTAVVIGLPDLSVTSVTMVAIEVAVSGNFSVTDSVRNLGNVAAAKSETAYRLSLDAVADVTDFALNGARSVNAVAAGATVSGSRSVKVPSSVPAGSYHVVACADGPLKIRELSEVNNCAATATTVRIGWADLTTSAVTYSQELVAPEQSVTVSGTVTNGGTITAGASTQRYYLSMNTVRDQGDTLFSATGAIPTLAPGAARTVMATLVVPAATPGGLYFLLACADDTSKVAEKEEGNNCTAGGAIRINRRPEAHAGDDHDTTPGATVQMSGLGSRDGDGQLLRYSWTVLALPDGSAATLSDASAATPSLQLDVHGQYVLQLTVSDEYETSAPDVVVLTTGATRFVALGDTGTGGAGQYSVGNAIRTLCARRGCGFAVLLGDNIYRSGVSSVDDPQFTTKFEAPYADIPMPFYAVLGNHDYGGNGDGDEFHKGQFEIDYTARSSRWRMPAAYYRFTAPPVEFFAIDTNMQMYGQDVVQRQVVDAWLAQSTSPWKVVLGHHPYRSNGVHGNAGAYNGTSGVPISSGDGVKSFAEAIVCGRADMWLSGHDHNLQWLQPVSTCPGTELIVSGAGAVPRELVDASSARYNDVFFQASTLGFVYIVATERQLTAVFVDADGRVLYVRTIAKPAP